MGVVYSDQLADEIVDWISQGLTLRDWCRQPNRPSFVAVYDWLAARPTFALRYARARETGADCIAQEALAIADTPHEGIRRKVTEQGEEVWHEDMLGHRKLQIETRLNLLGKWFPQKYGASVAMNLNGKIGVDMTVAEQAQTIRDKLRSEDSS